MLGDEFGLGDEEIGVRLDDRFSYGFMIFAPFPAEKRLYAVS